MIQFGVQLFLLLARCSLGSFLKEVQQKVKGKIRINIFLFFLCLSANCYSYEVNFSVCFADDIQAEVKHVEYLINLLKQHNQLNAIALSGVCFHKIKNYSKAIDEFDKVIGIDSRYPDIYYLKARAQMAQKKYDDAILSFEKEISINFRNFEAYLEMSRSYYLKGHLTKSILVLEKAVGVIDEFSIATDEDIYSYSPSEEKIYSFLGRLYKENNRNELAIKVLGDGLLRNGSSLILFEDLLALLKMAGDDEAIAQIKKKHCLALSSKHCVKK